MRLARLLEMLARLLGLLTPLSSNATPIGAPLCRHPVCRVASETGHGITPDASAVTPLPDCFLLLRTVTLAGMLVSPRGDARGGVFGGAGNFDLAECTLSSSFCIFPISPLIWYSEPARGTPSGCPACGLVALVVRRLNVGVDVVLPLCPIANDGPRICLGLFQLYSAGLGVTSASLVGTTPICGFRTASCVTGADDTDSIGDGGVGASDVVVDASDLGAGGVETTLVEEVVIDFPDDGDWGAWDLLSLILDMRL